MKIQRMAIKLNTPVPLDPLTEDEEDRRLWIGNLDPRITEYGLLKLLQQYGSIEKFDLLFHRSGPLKGQPRGYAFVTYSTKGLANAALRNLDGKLVGSKILSVKWAHTVSKDNLTLKQKAVANIPALAGAKNEKKLSKITVIQAIEAKLKTMEATKSSLQFEINNKPIVSTAYLGHSQYHLSQYKNIEKEKLRKKEKPYFRHQIK